MRVLGIDPGYERLGIAIMERTDGAEQVLFSTCLHTNKEDLIADRIHTLGVEFQKILVEYEPDAIGIETLFFNKNQKTAIAVAQARGMILFLAKAHGSQVCEFGPQEIKVAVTGYGKSDKNAVIDMVKRLAKGVPEKALDDEYDAIAVAITTLAHNRT